MSPQSPLGDGVKPHLQMPLFLQKFLKAGSPSSSKSLGGYENSRTPSAEPGLGFPNVKRLQKSPPELGADWLLMGIPASSVTLGPSPSPAVQLKASASALPTVTAWCPAHGAPLPFQTRDTLSLPIPPPRSPREARLPSGPPFLEPCCAPPVPLHRPRLAAQSLKGVGPMTLGSLHPP